MRVKKNSILTGGLERPNGFVFEIPSLILGLIAFIYVLTPFRFWERFVFPNQIETVVISTYLALIISGYLLLRIILYFKISKPRLSAIDVLLLIYLIYTGCRFLLQYNSINQEFIYESLTLIVLYVFFRSLSFKTNGYFLLLFPIAGIAQILYGIKYQTEYLRPGYTFSDVTGIFSNTGIFGGFIAIVSVVTLGIIINLSTSGLSSFKRGAIKTGKVLLVIVSLFILFQLIASNSRAAWLAFLIAAIYLLVTRFDLHTKFINLSIIKKVILILTSFCLLSIVLFGFYQLKRNSAEGRLSIWQVSTNMIKDKPILGYGINGFQANYMEYQGAYFQDNPGSQFSHLADDNRYAFNEFLKLLVEMGVVGLFLWIAMLYLLLFKTKVEVNEINNDWVVIIAKASLLSLFVFSLFSYPMSVFQFNILAVYFVAVLSKYSSIRKCYTFEGLSSHIKSTSNYRHFVKIGIIGLWLTSAVILTQSLVSYSYACKKWDFALKGFRQDNTTMSVETLESIYHVLKNNGKFLSAFGKALNKSGQFGKAIPTLLRANILLPFATNYIELGKSYKEMGEFAKARITWSKAAYMIPSMFTPKYLLAKMLYENGDIDNAGIIAKELLKKSVKIGTPGLSKMLKEMAEIVKGTNKTGSIYINNK